jgi:hypothetical protein
MSYERAARRQLAQCEQQRGGQPRHMAMPRPRHAHATAIVAQSSTRRGDGAAAVHTTISQPQPKPQHRSRPRLTTATPRHDGRPPRRRNSLLVPATPAIARLRHRWLHYVSTLCSTAGTTLSPSLPFSRAREYREARHRDAHGGVHRSRGAAAPSLPCGMQPAQSG